jgi:hypothetical protein
MNSWLDAFVFTFASQSLMLAVYGIVSGIEREIRWRRRNR